MAKTIPDHEVVVVTSLGDYRNNIPEILTLVRQTMEQWIDPPSDEDAIRSFEETIQRATAFLVLHRPNAQTIHIVGLAILSTIYAVGYTEGHITSFSILDKQAMNVTSDRKSLLTHTLIEYAKSANMVEISFVRTRAHITTPDTLKYHFRTASGWSSLDLTK